MSEVLDDPRRDRLFDLLPQVVRASDAYAGRPLQALLRVAAEQLGIVEDDVLRLLDNWFVETCDEWVLPYLGELIGQKPVLAIPVPPSDETPRGRERARAAYPRRAFARLVHSRRQKGVLLQLQDLARDLTGWPSRAVEFRTTTAASATVRFPDLGGARTVDLREHDRLDRDGGPFANLSRRADVRRIGSNRTPGHGNLEAVGLFVWRLKVNAIRAGEARRFFPPHQSHHHHHHHNDFRLDRYYLDSLGIDRPLFALADPLPDPNEPAGEMEVPGAIRSLALRDHTPRYYGPDKSLFLWRTDDLDDDDPQPSEATEAQAVEAVEVHDLEHWEHSLPPEHKATALDSCWIGAVIDPARGRVLYRREKHDDATTLWSRTHTAFPAEIGGGGYFRELPSLPEEIEHWTVGGPNPAYLTLGAALEAWDRKDSPRHVAIEIRDDATHGIGRSGRSFTTELREGDTLEVRAASHRRPVLRHPGGDDDSDWTIRTAPGAKPSIVLNGLAFADTLLRLEGTFAQAAIRHCTLSAGPDADGSLDLLGFDGCLAVERSVVLGTIHVRPQRGDEECDPKTQRHVKWPYPPPMLHPPANVSIADSILQANEDGAEERVALAGWPGKPGPGVVDRHPPGHVVLTILRSTVFGGVNVHAFDLAEDSIFVGAVRTSDTTRGCLRFCSLQSQELRTSPRHECLPDRVAAFPRFTSTRYGDPGYAQLSRDCPAEIARGSSDESEMGAFHDLYVPYREALLRAGLAECAPAGADAALRFVN